MQYSVFPVWFGTCLIAGFPSREIVVSRLAAFVINILTITATAAAAVYAAAGMRKEEVNRFGEFCGAGCRLQRGCPTPPAGSKICRRATPLAACFYAVNMDSR